MLIFVKGEADSGKSVLAEELARDFDADEKIYIATMKVMDDAGRERVERHRRQREGKGFTTIELESDIERALDLIQKPSEALVLLECISNLCGNELYDGIGQKLVSGELDEAGFAEHIVSEVLRLSKNVKCVIAVSSIYKAHDIGYDKETERYVRLLSMVNDRLSELSDEVRVTG